MINAALQAHLLKRAVHAFGLAELAKRLGVSEQSVREWLDRKAAMPEGAFSALVDIMIDVDGPPQP